LVVNNVGFLSLSNEDFNPWSDFNEGYSSNFESSPGGNDFSGNFFYLKINPWFIILFPLCPLKDNDNKSNLSYIRKHKKIINF